MTATTESMTALTTALNDPTRTRIGNPWTGTYHVSIKASDDSDATTLHGVLRELEVTSQINGGGDQKYIAIYDLRSLNQLLQAVGVDLEQLGREALDALVRARGPASELVVNTVRIRHERHGMSFSAIAKLLNEKGVVDGMGGRGWTVKKVRRLYRGAIS